MKRLSGWDAVLLYSETPTVHMHTLKLAVIDLAELKGRTFGIDEFRKVIHSRLYKLDPFRYELVDIPFKFHHPMWRENCEVDLDYHVRPSGSTAPADAANSTRRSAGSPAPRWTAAGHCGRCTSSRAWPTAGSRCSARFTTRWPTGSHRPICWRVGWTCRRAAGRTGLLCNRSGAHQGRAGALGVRRPHASDRPAARRDALHRAGHGPGAQEQPASCHPS